MSIKIYNFKEDAPLFHYQFGNLEISLTKRNIVYLLGVGGFPTIYFLGVVLGGGNFIIPGILLIVSYITGYILSIYRISSVPIDIYLYQKFLYTIKKEKIIKNKSIDFSKGVDFNTKVKNNIKMLLNENENN